MRIGWLQCSSHIAHNTAISLSTQNLARNRHFNIYRLPHCSTYCSFAHPKPFRNRKRCKRWVFIKYSINIVLSVFYEFKKWRILYCIDLKLLIKYDLKLVDMNLCQGMSCQSWHMTLSHEVKSFMSSQYTWHEFSCKFYFISSKIINKIYIKSTKSFSR